MQTLAVFDLDGTLLDSLRDIVACCNEALAAAGYPTHTYAEYLTYIGDGGYKLVERALPPEDRAEATIKRVRADYEGRYAQHYSVETRPFDGIVEMLIQLREAGILLAVLTNKGNDLAHSCVNAFLDGMVDGVLGQRDGLPQKPQPEGVYELIRSIPGADQSHCFFIGDSDVDIYTGINAGVRSLGVAWGYRSVEELIGAGAEMVAATPAELADYLIKESKEDAL